jgi:ATP-dependent exoDNAse (exonuclease V) alpha subunit
MKVANPHFKITIVQRSKGKSAVAGAAYQSGENLFSEYDQKHKDYRRKKGVVYTEVMLPPHAPRSYADREQLWNSVESVESQWNSQLARRFELALPREVPKELYPQMVQDYCNQFFVSKGMIVDFAIHDPKPPGHNPHCHVMLTMRALDEQGRWLPKARKVYDLDENGERIRLPSGRLEKPQRGHC